MLVLLVLIIFDTLGRINMPTLQQTLANATRSLHQRIEDNPFMHAMASKEPIEEPYRWLLTKLCTFAQLGERKLLDLIPASEGFTLSKRIRADLLLNDLTQMGILPETMDDDCFDTIDTKGKAIGLLYVMEGSRKGGQFLSALLQQSNSPLPMSYLQGYGYETDTQWEQFCTLLERYTHTPLEEEIIAGAISAFEILERIFHEQ